MGKKHDNLIEQIADWDNLLCAYQKARIGKRDREEVQRFSSDLWLELGNIQLALLSGTYCMGPYRSFVVFEPKRREILAAPFRDRVVQHAIVNVLEPIWDKVMIEDTYACRPGKGTHAGADRIQRWLRDMNKTRPLPDIWIAKTDYSKYFQSIPHAALKRVTRRKIACEPTLALLDTIIDSTPGSTGIPVGNLTSQWLANLLGNEIDQWAKRDAGVRRYLRYMDDIIAIFATKAEAQLFVARLEDRSMEYGLRYSKASVQRASFGVNALGYRIWPTHRLLRKRSIIKFRRDMKWLIGRLENGEIGLEDIGARVKAWVGHAKHADTHRLRTAILSQVVFPA